ncbi:S-adenosyl-L-homocysteine hydrolase, NAD binding domain protein [Fusobacterium necrophorum subsp. funduliforme ATCC 51357]|uniref:Hydroxyacid dehydrogenase n=1 Tax=Fusobacterium necrophorum subsp. funduliforme TaxID=143387 RepID=A0A170MWX2_9FUSO|nr:2-hydroxyacid dehydrogenase [Fusobacterium necrophorum]EIJ73031.1 S-adenosyl-L-homocysteine hydrolase, NAD binding domain protein [Fusobacterium necrophorum subsp. funduliforme ATCC 51357]KAB0552324.1 2-hydroxyacid dehydrogenase [Fusobacterium necrophorum subsp. funduliforme]KYL04991.1 hydroxyacid dehydrogenase [Fusobacterium necrophorum subsp. funduliforme]KYM62837.1 hydroxyacid dehydrogenase [Fusobacterium necrophorum subsp. funduliforme]KYM67056.1 hydroxyacid dehydrogenase [Fusobacterium
MKVLFFDAKAYDKENFDAYKGKYSFDIKYLKVKLNEETVDFAKGYEIISIFVNDTVNPPVIDKLLEYGVKLIVLRCAGYNNVDVNYINGRIKLVRVPAYSPYSVAEYTASLIMTLNRKIHKAYLRTREGNFSINGLMGFDLHRKTIGVIGAGRIARIFIKIMRGFDARVIAYDPYPDESFAKELGYEYVDLETLYRQSDIISLHCPLTKENTHLINRDSMKKMKNGVMLVNTGRGRLIDTIDLIEALKEKKVGAAALDVYEEEAGYFFEDMSSSIIEDDILGRLLSFNNVLLTSHQAYFTKEAFQDITITTLENIQSFLKGNELENEIK